MDIARTIFKILIMVFLVVIVGYFGNLVIKNFFLIDKNQKEINFLIDFRNFVNGNKKYFSIEKFDKNLALICISNSLKKEELEDLGLNVEYNFSIIKKYSSNFKDEESLKHLMENGQKNLFIIYENGEWSSYFVKNILLSTNQLPFCLVPGEKIKKNEYYGKVDISKTTGRSLSEFI